MKKSNIVCLALAVVCIVYGQLTTDIYVRQIISMIGINYILAAGLNLIFGHTGQISIGQAGLYALGAYTSSIFEVKLGVPFFIAWLAAILLTCIVAYLIGKPILKLHGHYLAMATIAFGMIIDSLAVNWIPVTSGHDGIYIASKSILGEFLSSNISALIVLCAAAAFIVSNNIEKSRIGRAIRAVSEDEDGAAAVGIEHSKYKVIMFVMGALFSAVAGIMYAHLNTVITPEIFNLQASQLILIMVVVGGIGSNWGVFLGSAIITILPELLYGFADYNILVYGLLVLVIQLFAPRGLAGVVTSIGQFFKKLLGKKSQNAGGEGK